MPPIDVVQRGVLRNSGGGDAPCRKMVEVSSTVSIMADTPELPRYRSSPEGEMGKKVFAYYQKILRSSISKRQQS